jgi:hypothetical protein
MIEASHFWHKSSHRNIRILHTTTKQEELEYGQKRGQDNERYEHSDKGEAAGVNGVGLTILTLLVLIIQVLFEKSEQLSIKIPLVLTLTPRLAHRYMPRKGQGGVLITISLLSHKAWQVLSNHKVKLILLDGPPHKLQLKRKEVKH